jgi:hypothetical protein
MEKPDFDPKKIPPQPSLKKTIWQVVLFHLAIVVWVVAIIITKNPVRIF